MTFSLPARVTLNRSSIRIGRSFSLCLLLVSWACSAIAADVRLLSNDETGVRLRYFPTGVSWNHLQVADRSYDTPVVTKTGVPWEVGFPQLPQRVIWLTLPPGTSPQLITLIPYGVKTLPQIPAPVPMVSSQPGGSITSDFTEGATYFAPAPFPNNWVQLAPVSQYRDLQVVQVLVYPYRFPTATGGLLTFDSLDVQIQFQGSKTGITTFPSGQEDQFYRGFIANWFGAARNWRVSPARAIAVQNAWPTGDLYKIKIGESGIYRLTYYDLLNAGLDLSNLDPRNLHLFNNGGERLPTDPDDPRPEELLENALYFYGDEEDGSFDPGEEIWFYGQSVHDWKWSASKNHYQHYRNPFTDQNVYWLNYNPGGPLGRRMEFLSQTGAPTFTSASTRAFLCEEQDLYVLYNSYNLPLGLPDFYGDSFSGAITRTYSENLENFDATNAEARLVLRFRQPDTASQHFLVRINGVQVATITSSSLIIESDILFTASLLNSGNNSIQIQHTSTSIIYLDYYELHYSRVLNTTASQLAFISPTQSGVIQYQITGMTDPWIFDITDFDSVRLTQNATFIDSNFSSSPRRYLAIENSAFKTPLTMEMDQVGPDGELRSNHEANLLVLCAEDFYTAMEPYESYRESSISPTPLEVLRVRLSDVFDEFGWGLVDPTALRDFLMSTLTWTTRPLYVLFVGDGDFDYKNHLSYISDNWLIPYENEDICTDDWYAYFNASYPELTMSRWPVRSIADVQTSIERLIEYETQPEMGPWLNLVTFVADDEYGPTYSGSELAHIQNTENIAQNIFPALLNQEKIYLTEYPSTYNPAWGGQWKPEANRALLDAINQGRLLVHYMGHGNPTVWAHESVFLKSRDLPQLQNGSKLPLFIAATCDWAYWDSPFEQSMPEEMLTLAGGGAIAAVAATRLTYSGSNNQLAQNFYAELFPDSGQISIGDALRQAKASFYGVNTNAQKYHLLGDPFMKLAFPQLQVTFDPSSTDTLQALQFAQLSGALQSAVGTPVFNFSGVAHLQVFGPGLPVHHWLDNTAPAVYLDYVLPGNLIFRGDVAMSGPQFEATFITPVDISYGGQGGRFSVLVYSNESLTAGLGAFDSVFFGQSAPTLQDSVPPDLDLYLQSPQFQAGDPVNPQTTLFVVASDSHGINLTGSIGHGIVVILDGLTSIDLTEAFTYDLNSYTSGQAQYTFAPGELSPGTHTLAATVWDAANNPGSAQTNFVVVSTDEMRLADVLNYPNPFGRTTQFTFVLTESAEVTIKIYTVAGRLIKVISGIPAVAGFNATNPQLTWEGRDERGDLLSNGVYLYKVIARGYQGSSVEELSKLVILR